MASDFRETLYTVDKTGKRRWLYPTLVKGSFYYPRFIVAVSLILFYICMPWVEIAGKQGIRLDIIQRKFTFFGTTFWATDTLLLVFVLAALAFSLFLFTALFGRVWCGWACPETVFLEFLFRPIERLIEGSAAQRSRLDKQPWNANKIFKKLLKHGLCAFFAWVLATSFVAYFVGADLLIDMMTDWPHKNPVPFALTVIFMCLFGFQFGWFREQFCTVLCPYARFQSVMLDPNSLVVAYDSSRGEPRGKVRRGTEVDSRGDCVDCRLCVRVCPTGIDIRNGLQLECVSCAQCVDACDSIMTKVGRATGLIRYDTEARMEGRQTHFMRPRTIIYSLMLLAILSGLVYSVRTRPLSDFQVLRGALDAPYKLLADGRVSNHMHIRIANKAEVMQRYTVAIESTGQGTGETVEVVTPIAPYPVEAGQIATMLVFFNFSSDALQKGKLKATVTLQSDKNYKGKSMITLLGPGK